MIIIFAVVLTFSLMMTGNYSSPIHAIAERITRSTITTISPSVTSHDILAKVLIDNAIQTLQDENRTKTIEYLIATDHELTSEIESENPSSAIEPRFIVEYLAQLMQKSTDSVTNNKALVYLNLVDSQLVDMLNEPTQNLRILS